MTVEEKLKWQIEICGIDKYHAKGYKGQGITVLCHEDNEHGRQAMSILQMVAPEVSIVYSSVNRKEKDGKLVEFVWTINGKTYSFDEVIKVFKPDIISCSLRSPTSTIERDAIVKPYIDNGELIIVTSAGNEGASGGAQPMYDCGLVIGACQFFNGNKNDIRITSYSGRTSGKLDVDYVGFMGDWNGTSAATPFVAGQIALFMCRYGKVAQLTFQKLIKQYCKDLGDSGTDWAYGDGLIVLPDNIERNEETQMADKKFNTVDEFKKYLSSLNISRKIKFVQLHHTWSPNYSHFNGKNHETLQNNMRNYHVNTNGWSDIAQNLTIFPDGVIMLGRHFNVAPAGIKGANSNGICIECVGNFDNGGDTMTETQKNAIVGVVAVLLKKFNLNVYDNVTYHSWWSSDGRDLGDYFKNASAKTCPGTNFFGGNTLTAYTKNLKPLIENYGKVEKIMLESGNDIVWELMNGKHKIEIAEVERAIKAIDNAKKSTEFCSLYWILYKLVNK